MQARDVKKRRSSKEYLCEVELDEDRRRTEGARADETGTIRWGNTFNLYATHTKTCVMTFGVCDKVDTFRFFLACSDLPSESRPTYVRLTLWKVKKFGRTAEVGSATVALGSVFEERARFGWHKIEKLHSAGSTPKGRAQLAGDTSPFSLSPSSLSPSIDSPNSNQRDSPSIFGDVFVKLLYTPLEVRQPGIQL